MPLTTSISLIIIGGAILVGKALYDLIGCSQNDSGSSTKKPSQDNRQDQIARGYRGLETQVEVAKPRETRFPADYGSQGTYQREQQQRSAASNSSFVRPITSQPPINPSAGPNGSGNARRSATYSSVIVPNAGSNARYSPYSTLEQTTYSSHRSNRPGAITNNEVFSDVSNRFATPATRGRVRVSAHRRTRRQGYVKQTIPRKTKDELRALIELEFEVAKSKIQYTIRDTTQVGFEKRKAAKEQLCRADAARVLKEKAFRENCVDDGRLLFSMRNEYFDESKRLHKLAETEIFAHYNPSHYDSVGNEKPRRRCDLHGLYIEEAREAAKCFLATCVEKKLRDVKIIVGKGIHSEDGEAKLKPAILKLLRGKSEIEEFKVDEANEGCILVRLKSESFSETSRIQ